MSAEGIKLAAGAFSHLQQVRNQLIGLGTAKAGTPEGNQDILLGQLLDDAKDHIKVRFTEETLKPEAMA